MVGTTEFSVWVSSSRYSMPFKTTNADAGNAACKRFNFFLARKNMCRHEQTEKKLAKHQSECGSATMCVLRLFCVSTKCALAAIRGVPFETVTRMPFCRRRRDNATSRHWYIICRHVKRVWDDDESAEDSKYPIIGVMARYDAKQIQEHN